MISGFGIGAALAIGTSYASEVAPLRLRAPVQQGIVLFTVIMHTMALGIVRAFVPDIAPHSFSTVFAIQWALGGLSAIAFAAVPESPVYLVNRGRLDAARRTLNRICAGNSVDARMQELVQTIEEEQAAQRNQQGSYLECFKGTNLKRTMTAALTYSAIQIGGGPLLTQNILILIVAGLPAIHAFDIGIGGFALAVVGIVLNWFTMRFFPPTQHVHGWGYRQPHHDGRDRRALLRAWRRSTMGCCGFDTILLQVMGFPIADEISTYRLRGKTISIAAISMALTNWLFSFVVPYMYNVDTGNLGLRSAFVFAALSVFLIVGAWFYIPDTTLPT
ncbi:hypothetical protein LQW54_013348 [Pestalotiopsis sp. IQ-011]